MTNQGSLGDSFLGERGVGKSLPQDFAAVFAARRGQLSNSQVGSKPQVSDSRRGGGGQWAAEAEAPSASNCRRKWRLVLSRSALALRRVRGMRLRGALGHYRMGEASLTYATGNKAPPHVQ